ncbi:MAG: hypothetical protein ACPGXZ_17380 [Saprospiraceae bacterium]
MNTQKTAALIAFYGGFLLVLSIIYIVLIGFNLTIEMSASLIAGLFSLSAAFFMLRRRSWAFWGGLAMSFLMIVLMGWRSVIALFHFTDMIQNDKLNNPYDSGIAFMIVFSVFLLSVLTSAIQIMLARSNARELNN